MTDQQSVIRFVIIIRSKVQKNLSKSNTFYGMVTYLLTTNIILYMPSCLRWESINMIDVVKFVE